jgi:YHS domain-containing protein
MAVDPVCETPVNPHTAKGGMIWYKGAPYYFCSETCKEKFDIAPATYAPEGPIVPGVRRA